MFNRDRYRVVVNGDAGAKATRTRRSAEQWAELAEDAGLEAHVEPTRLCLVCETHACPGGTDCPDA